MGLLSALLPSQIALGKVYFPRPTCTHAGVGMPVNTIFWFTAFCMSCWVSGEVCREAVNGFSSIKTRVFATELSWSTKGHTIQPLTKPETT